jgi:hypothetical protein
MLTGQENRRSRRGSGPDLYREVAWSPDGNVLALATLSYKGPITPASRRFPSMVAGKAFDFADVVLLDQLAWTGDGSGLIVSAVEQSFGQHQLFYVIIPAAQFTASRTILTTT